MNLTSEEGGLSPQVQFKRIAEFEARGHFEPIHPFNHDFGVHGCEIDKAQYTQIPGRPHH